jgi:hypothetical protein
MSYFSVWNKLDTILCSERLGEARSCQAMMEFSNFIFYQGLMDLPFVGGSFTWSNNRDSFAWSRIDRFIVSPAWEAQFPGVPRGGFLDFVWIISLPP